MEALEATNEAALSHRQNDVLRVLTIFSVLLLPLTLIASVFGMNVAFPGHELRLPSGSSSSRWSACWRSARVLPAEALLPRSPSPLNVAGDVLILTSCPAAGLNLSSVTRPMWAPWRLEYVGQADEQNGCIFCRAWGPATSPGSVVHRGSRRSRS